MSVWSKPRLGNYAHEPHLYGTHDDPVMGIIFPLPSMTTPVDGYNFVL